MKKFYKEHTPAFWGIVAGFWAVLMVVGLFLHWTLLSEIMLLSLTASGLVFSRSAVKDREWIEKYGDPDELARREKARAQAEAEAAEMAESAEEAESVEAHPVSAADEMETGTEADEPESETYEEELEERGVDFIDEDGELEEAVDVDYEVER